MLRLYIAEQADSLLERLAVVLDEPLDDPFVTEWIAAPTQGMHQWLRHQLSERLGTSGPGRQDGITANVDLAFPGSLFGRVMHLAGESDPWQVDRLAWAVLQVLLEGADDPVLANAGLTTKSEGATWYGRARRLADLFDRYSFGRPSLINHWSEGRDLDPMGTPLPPALLWQPHLWRKVRTLIDHPVTAERLDRVLADLRSGVLDPELPTRLSIFGVNTIPGGLPFLDLLDAIGTTREVHLFLLTPSMALSESVRTYPLGQAPTTQDRSMIPRNDDTASGALANHPLLRSWGRSSRETAVLLAAGQEQRRLPDPLVLGTPADGASGSSHVAGTILRRVQADIRLNRRPSGDHRVAPDDQSIRIHSCHGATRQVEVLRDAILHLLADDPTLRENDIAVLCPQLDVFAPLVEAVWGPSVGGSGGPDPDGPPALRYRVADRLLRLSDPLIGALASLLDLLGSRFTASAVSDFLALEPVQLRFGLDDEDLQVFNGWIADSGVRWGLDASHRAEWGLPDEFGANSWRAGLDRLLMGVMLGDEEGILGPGDVVPEAVEGSDVLRLGRLAEVLSELDQLERRFSERRSVSDWCDLLAETADRLLAVPWDENWQRQRLMRVLDGIAESGFVGGEPSHAPLELNDIRRLLRDLLGGEPGRISFFDGALTVTSALPLRGLPHRVVCLLGLDQDAFTTPSLLGDDLMSQNPIIGDGDARAESRHTLLDALLMAQDHLVITRTGHDPRTNQPMPAATPVAELLDTLHATAQGTKTATGHSTSGDDGPFEIVHPRQAFDGDNFIRTGPSKRVWSFDRRALAGALDRSDEPPRPRALLDAPLPPKPLTDVGLADLHNFLAHPVRAFFTQRLEVTLPRETEPLDDTLPAELGGLGGWAIAARLLDTRLEGGSFEDWLRIERARGALPPGSLSGREVEKQTRKVDAVLEKAAELGIVLAVERTDRRINVELPSGIGLAGSLKVRDTDHGAGPVQIMVSTFKPKHHLAVWLDLMALTAADPSRQWRGVVIGRKGNKTDQRDLIVRPGPPDQQRAIAMEALDRLVALYRMGMQEPLPLFAETSYAMYKDWPWVGSWNGDLAYGGGDGDDPHNILAFGHLLASDVAHLPVQRHDPPGRGEDRASRYAHHLWTLVNKTGVGRANERDGS